MQVQVWQAALFGLLACLASMPGLGGTVLGTVDAPIPRRADRAHELQLTDKTGTTPKAYPRKAGTPGKKPLGM